MSKRKKYKSTLPPFAKRTCALCGKTFPALGNFGVVGITGRAACNTCLNSMRPDSNEQKRSQTGNQITKILTPQEMIQKLNESIIGQDRAKYAVAVALWKQQLRAAGNPFVPKSNLLLYGPTGCGKTAIVREACKIAGLPFISFDATSLSETGYRGKDAQDMIKELYARFSEHPKLPYGVVFLDEVDKLAAKGNESRSSYTRGTQHTLLKLIEGVDVTCEITTLSTENMLFIFGGAFTSLASQKNDHLPKRSIGFLQASAPASSSGDITISDFIHYGMEPELLGRVGRYIPVNALTKVELKQILLESKTSVFLKYQEFFIRHKVHLTLCEAWVEKILNEALERGMGARGLFTLVEEAVEPLLFRLAEGSLEKEAKLGESVVSMRNNPIPHNSPIS